MEDASRRMSAWNRLRQHWVSSFGIQAWLVEAARTAAADRIRALLDQLEPESPPGSSRSGNKPVSAGVGPDTDLHSMEGLGKLMETLRQALVQLDDVQDYSLVEALDNQMYQLWKELERTMQRHRRSEARFQLKEMFRI